MFELGADGRLRAMGRAERARAVDPKSWELSGYTESRFTGDAVDVTTAAARELKSAASAGFLQLTVTRTRVRPQSPSARWTSVSWCARWPGCTGRRRASRS